MSANATMSSNFAWVSALVRPRMAAFRKMFSRPVYSGLKPLPSYRRAALRPEDAPGARAVAAFVAAHDGRECPFVFTGDSAIYLLAHACTPTAYAFPSTLSYASEQGSTGIDEAAEVRRVMARRPPVVVTLAEPLAPLNLASLRVMRAALARDYRPAFSAPGHYSRVIVWLRTARSAPKRTR